MYQVFKNEEGFKAAWFTANILTLKDGKAYVGYTSLVAVEGLSSLCLIHACTLMRIEIEVSVRKITIFSPFMQKPRDLGTCVYCMEDSSKSEHQNVNAMLDQTI